MAQVKDLIVNGDARIIGNLYANLPEIIGSKVLNNYYTSRIADANVGHIKDGSVITFKATSSMTANKPPSDAHILHFNWDNTAGYDSQLALGNGSTPHIHLRGQNAGTWGSWITVIDSSGGTMNGRLTANGKISTVTSAGNWLSGKTITNATIGITTKQTEASYHPVLAIQSYAGNVLNIGGLKDNIGFYGYYAARTENGTDFSTVWNTSTGKLTHNKDFEVSGSTTLKAVTAGAITASSITISGDGCVKGSFDLSAANNGVTNVTYPTFFNILDKNSRIATRLEGIVETNGNMNSYWYLRNYKTDGTQVAQKGIKMTMDKAGNLTYNVADSANFISAIGAVKKAGDTMTGKLTISNDTATTSTALSSHLVLRSTNGNAPGIEFYRSGAAWQIVDESGALVIRNDYTTTKQTTYSETALKLNYNHGNAEFHSSVVPNADNTRNLGTSSLKWANVYATTFTGALSGNASTATKLQNARTITHAGDLAGSYSFDGNGNVTDTAWIYNCRSYNANSNVRPYHRIGYVPTITGAYVDRPVLLYITQGYNGGNFGLVRISVRTNSSSSTGSISSAEVVWLIRKGFPLDYLQVGLYNVGGATYADAFIKATSNYQGTTIRALGDTRDNGVLRTWTLVSSNENGTSYTECYSDIQGTAAGTAAKDLHNGTQYTNVVTGVDGGIVNQVANSLTISKNNSNTTYNGSSAQTISIPTVHTGSAAPSASTGANGDIYIQV